MGCLHRNYHVTKSPGVYTLILQVKEQLSLSIGSLGRVNLAAGQYLYTGSALGPGGLDSRVARHLSKEKRVFWHIDYLTVNQQVNVLALVRAECLNRMECRVNGLLLSRFGAECTVLRFGSSDCSECPGHLLCAKYLELGVLIKKMKGVYLEAGLKPTSNTFSSKGHL